MLGRGPACMARPYSRDLRERVVGAVEGGLSRRRAASVFGVGIATVIDWVAVWRESGRVSAKPMGGDHNSRLKGERAWLLERIEAVPDLTLKEIRAELAQRGLHVGYGTVWRFFAAERHQLQKKSCTPASKSGLTSPRRASPGKRINPLSIRRGSSSSTKPAPPPTWPGCAAGPSAVTGSSAECRGAIGRR